MNRPPPTGVSAAQPLSPPRLLQGQVDLDRAELERLRWYLEDYLEYPIDPAPKIAAQVEQRLVELGRDLFGQVFQVREATRLWDRAEPGQDQRSADGRPSRDHRASLR